MKKGQDIGSYQKTAKGEYVVMAVNVSKANADKVNKLAFQQSRSRSFIVNKALDNI